MHINVIECRLYTAVFVESMSLTKTKQVFIFKCNQDFETPNIKIKAMRTHHFLFKTAFLDFGTGHTASFTSDLPRGLIFDWCPQLVKCLVFSNNVL